MKKIFLIIALFSFSLTAVQATALKTPTESTELRVDKDKKKKKKDKKAASCCSSKDQTKAQGSCSEKAGQAKTTEANTTSTVETKAKSCCSKSTEATKSCH